MSIFEYDEKAVRQVYYEDGLQAGRKDGIKTGKKIFSGRNL